MAGDEVVGEMVEARAGAEQRGFLLYVFTPVLNLGAQWQKDKHNSCPPEAPGPEQAGGESLELSSWGLWQEVTFE